MYQYDFRTLEIYHVASKAGEKRFHSNATLPSPLRQQSVIFKDKNVYMCIIHLFLDFGSRWYEDVHVKKLSKLGLVVTF